MSRHQLYTTTQWPWFFGRDLAVIEHANETGNTFQQSILGGSMATNQTPGQKPGQQQEESNRPTQPGQQQPGTQRGQPGQPIERENRQSNNGNVNTNVNSSKRETNDQQTPP